MSVDGTAGAYARPAPAPDVPETPECRCTQLTSQTPWEPAEWEQADDCPVHPRQPADLLRTAAALMRERAEAVVSGGQWSNGNYWITDYDPSDPSGQTAVQRLIGGMEQPDATHYSSWPPAVALAVADWLEVTARDVGTSSIAYHAALATARAHLGSTR